MSSDPLVYAQASDQRDPDPPSDTGATTVRYVWNPSRDKRRVMHIATFNQHGQMTGRSFCGRGPFRRSINAPFGLGRRICKDCRKRADA